MFFMPIKMLPFLFLFACMCFVLFVRVKSSCKKKIKRFKTALIPSFTILLTGTPLNLSMENYFINYSYLWSSVKIFPFYENLLNLSLLWESFESFPFMRIFLNLFLFMIIRENLFFLWESFWISSYLSQSFFIITVFFNYHNIF